MVCDGVPVSLGLWDTAGWFSSTFRFSYKRFFRSGGLWPIEAPLLPTGAFTFRIEEWQIQQKSSKSSDTITNRNTKYIYSSPNTNKHNTPIEKKSQNKMIFFSDWRLPNLFLRCQSLFLWECNLKMVRASFYIWSWSLIPNERFSNYKGHNLLTFSKRFPTFQVSRDKTPLPWCAHSFDR